MMMISTAILESCSLFSLSLYCLGLSVATFFLKRYLKWFFSPLHKAPGPKNHSFLLGHFVAILKEPFMEPHQRWWSKYNKDVPFLAYSNLFGSWSLLLLDTDLWRTVLTSSSATQYNEHPRFLKNIQFLRGIVGDNLGTLETNQQWKRHKRILQPSFQINAIREALDIVASRKTRTMLKTWKEKSTQSGCVCIHAMEHMSTLTLDILGEAALDYSFGGEKAFDEWANSIASHKKEHHAPRSTNSLRKTLAESLQATFIPVLLGALNMSFLEKLLNRKGMQTAQALDATIHSILDSARTKKPNNATTASLRGKTLLDVLLKANDKRGGEDKRNYLTNAELKDNLKFLLLAGHETTANWCTWALYALGRFPEVQEKVRQDIRSVVNEKNHEITVADTDRMKYLQAFLKEVLRLYPPVGVYVRFTTRDEMWNGVAIPRNTRINLPVFLLHRHPRYWKDPLKFEPDRFLRDYPQMAFQPFSTGLRSCIGRYFAEVEARIVIANIVRDFHVQLDMPEEVVFTNMTTLKSKPPIRVKVSPIS